MLKRPSCSIVQCSIRDMNEIWHCEKRPLGFYIAQTLSYYALNN